MGWGGGGETKQEYCSVAIMERLRLQLGGIITSLLLKMPV